MTDIRMLETDGLSFLKSLRDDPALADLPAIVLSGYVAPESPSRWPPSPPVSSESR